MIPARLKRIRFVTHLFMGWERQYAIWALPLAVTAIWASLSLLGAWHVIPPWTHGLGLVVLIGSAAGLYIRGRRQIPSVGRRAVDRRLERDANLPTGLLEDLADRPFADDRRSALWQRHVRQLEEISAQAQLERAPTQIDKTDPYALRFAALLALVLGLVIAGDQILPRLKAGLFPAFGARTVIVADVWIDPPPYTGLAPQFLVRSSPLTSVSAPQIDVPEGSVFKVQLSRPDGKPIKLKSHLASQSGTKSLPATIENNRTLLTTSITENAAIEIRSHGRRAIWPLKVIPDAPPRVSWNTLPETKGGTRTTFSLLIEDDYGITDADLVLTMSGAVQRPPDAPRPSADILGEPEVIALPSLHGSGGIRYVDIDLTEHPWAGLPVTVNVVVRDGLEQEAISTLTDYALPIRTFYNPLARTVLEQRQSLALAPDSWRRSSRLLDALTFAPDQFARSGREYLLIRSAYHQVFNRAEDDSANVVASLWPLAISLEDEGLTLARQRLEAAQTALREALARGAPQDEIDRLIEELRQAMADYMAALSQSDYAPMAEGEADMEAVDLQDILDEIAELRRQGDTEAARRRLAELEEMLRNLQFTQGEQGDGSGDEGQGGGQASGQGQGSNGNESGSGSGEGGGLDAASDLIQQQRDLSDETFSARRFDRGPEGLSEAQRALADAAAELQGMSGDDANGSSDEAQAAFGQAEDAMRRAAEALATGDLGRANSLQEFAIDALRAGGRAMSDAARAAEEGNPSEDQNAAGSVEGQRGGLQGSGEERDPLGRIFGRQGETGVEIPDFTDPERVRELTDQLREKLSDPDLSDAQRQYIERLLERF